MNRPVPLPPKPTENTTYQSATPVRISHHIRSPFKPINVPLYDSIQAIPNHHLKQNEIYNTLKDTNTSTEQLNNIFQNTYKLPSNFNPRKESNMSHQEKVDSWILQVPTSFKEDIESWENNCYKPLVPISDKFEDTEGGDFDFTSTKDVIEFQSRMITFLVNQGYFNDIECVRKSNGELVEGGFDFDSIYIDATNDYSDVDDLSQYQQFKDYRLQSSL